MLERLITPEQRDLILPWRNVPAVRGQMYTQHWITPEELRDLGQQTRTAWQALGTVREGPRESEATQRPLRRSLYVAKDMKAGEVFTPENVKSVGPGYGLEPRYYEALIGRRAPIYLAAGTRVPADSLKSFLEESE